MFRSKIENLKISYFSFFFCNIPYKSLIIYIYLIIQILFNKINYTISVNIIINQSTDANTFYIHCSESESKKVKLRINRKKEFSKLRKIYWIRSPSAQTGT